MRRSPLHSARHEIGPWVWLFPLAYGLHVAEEYWLHFPEWVSNFSQSFVSNPQFLFLNGVFWLLMVASVVAIRARASLTWLVATLAAILGINAALHLLGSLVTRTYSPGSITAALLYIPLVVYAFRQVLPRVSRGVALRAVGLGAAIHVGVMLLAAHPLLLPSM
ncbi:hypothetical protein BWI17_03730 [Betaproteobacteria bacterium GR16-43]|nr:hypothetical protein BWI17_03730 [Betaproteobacteria bacterium GR16-43]